MFSRLSRRAKLGFISVYIAIAAMASIGGTSDLWQDKNGGTAAATVLAVRSQTFYTVSFVTADGTRCEGMHKWPAHPDVVTVGDVFDVHYSSNASCSNIRRESDDKWWYSVLIGPSLMMAGIIAFLVVKRRPY